jgi:hypothetical protein
VLLGKALLAVSSFTLGRACGFARHRFLGSEPCPARGQVTQKNRENKAELGRIPALFNWVTSVPHVE